MFLLTPYKRNLIKTNKTFYDMVDDLFNDSFFSTQNSFKIDVKENEDAFLIYAELPGYKKEEIKLEYNDEKLLIAVDKEEKIDEEKENYIHKERKMSSMQRGFYLKDIDSDKIEAKLENGVLMIIAPKKENLVNRKQIEVK